MMKLLKKVWKMLNPPEVRENLRFPKANKSVAPSPEVFFGQ